MFLQCFNSPLAFFIRQYYKPKLPLFQISVDMVTMTFKQHIATRFLLPPQSMPAQPTLKHVLKKAHGSGTVSADESSQNKNKQIFTTLCVAEGKEIASDGNQLLENVPHGNTAVSVSHDPHSVPCPLVHSSPSGSLQEKTPLRETRGALNPFSVRADRLEPSNYQNKRDGKELSLKSRKRKLPLSPDKPGSCTDPERIVRSLSKRESRPLPEAVGQGKGGALLSPEDHAVLSHYTA